MYHGTKPQYVESIIVNGLRPGSGQAHQGKKDPWG
jgi:RNA:NAD 2'-phosphotransferase (TPT1/KptA family)